MKKIVLVFCAILFLFASCGTARKNVCHANGRVMKVRIDRIERDRFVTYLYGTYNSREIKIASLTSEKYRKNRTYEFKKITLLDLFIEYMIISPHDILHVHMSDERIPMEGTYLWVRFKDRLVVENPYLTREVEEKAREFFEKMPTYLHMKSRRDSLNSTGFIR